MKSQVKALTSAQKKRKETICIGQVVEMNGKKMQLLGHSNSGNQIWKEVK